MVKSPIKHSMLRRLSGWNYRGRGIYQITLTLENRASQALGRIVVADGQGGWVGLGEARRLGLTPEEVEAKVELSALGEQVLACWRELGELWLGVKPLEAAVMPDHFHGILFVETPQEKPLGSIVGSFKARTSSIYLAASGQAQNPARGQAGGGGSCGRPLAAGLWSKGYQDTVLLHEGQLDNMFRYLRDNARRGAIKALFPALFRVVGELKVTLPGLGGAIGRFSALGNRFLLGRPLIQVQCSRSFFRYRRIAKPTGGLKIACSEAGEPLVEFSSPEFEEKKDLLLNAAKHGSVLISPCVSDGEREIARLALNDELPLITLHNKGFSPLQKPGGRYFNACSDGRLLMLAPAAWPYQTDEKPMTRDAATAMNRLCQWLVGEGAAEINYHGVSPLAVDASACAAALIAL